MYPTTAKRIATTSVTEDARPSSPSDRLTPFDIATSVKITKGMKSNPKFTYILTNGISTSVPFPPSIMYSPIPRLSNTCSNIFCFAVSPRLFFLAIFSKSSRNPIAPNTSIVRIIAKVSAASPFVTIPVTSPAAIPRTIMTPPIVGVPAFFLCASGPSSRMNWPNCFCLRNGIRSLVPTVEMSNDTIKTTTSEIFIYLFLAK